MRKGFTRKPSDEAEESSRAADDALGSQRGGVAGASPDVQAASVRNYITPDGLLRLKDERRFLLTRERPAVTKVVAWAASNGDRSENADYQYGKRRLRSIDRRIRFLTKRIDAAHVVDPDAARVGRAATRVFFGATVRYANAAGTERVVSVVGRDEVDLDRNHISWASPLARALMQAGPGDCVLLHAPRGTEQLRVMDVRYQRIPVEPFSEPPGAEAAATPRAPLIGKTAGSGREARQAPKGRRPSPRK
ncbi:MAG: transcription elongation factor GreB [Acidobacteria bacterium]|nr:transcription elongation factor GreB [Acidobacteriota bacterium]